MKMPSTLARRPVRGRGPAQSMPTEVLRPADAIRDLNGTAKPGQIAERLGKERSNVGHLMAKMAESGILTSIATGTYSLPKPIPIIPTVPTLGDTDGETGNAGNTGNRKGAELEIF